jgi:hypothetical protein
MRHSKPFAAAVAFVLLAFSGVAGAQTRGEDYGYRFDDDLMLGDTLSSPPPIIEMRKKLPRITLIRPRPSFVGEMLQSIEVL